MVHNLNILHSQYFHPLLDHLLGISTQPIVQLHEIVVISIEPHPFPSVYFDDSIVQLIDLPFQRLNPVLLVAYWVGMLLQDVLLVFFHLFYLVLDVRAIIQQQRVDQSVNLEDQTLLYFIEFVEGLHFLLFDCVHSMFQLKQALHAHGPLCHFLLQTGHISEQQSQLLKSLVFKQLEIEFPAVDEGIEIQTFQLFGGFFYGFEQERQGGRFEILVDEGELCCWSYLRATYEPRQSFKTISQSFNYYNKIQSINHLNITLKTISQSLNSCYRQRAQLKRTFLQKTHQIRDAAGTVGLCGQS